MRFEPVRDRLGEDCQQVVLRRHQRPQAVRCWVKRHVAELSDPQEILLSKPPYLSIRQAIQRGHGTAVQISERVGAVPPVRPNALLRPVVIGHELSRPH